MKSRFIYLLILIIKLGYSQVPTNLIPNSSFELGNLGANMYLIKGNGRLYNMSDESQHINN
jgi:hypothetical protein